MQVKICGITTKEAALTAVEAGADLVGFVFAESKRKITPVDAKKIAESLPDHVRKVGVFVNEEHSKVQEIADFVGLDIIQLHGDEPASYAQALEYPVIRAYSVNQIEDSSFPCQYFLIDSPKGMYRGGTGTPFDWSLLEQTSIDRNKLILAGGLTVENVNQAILTVKPHTVDVSSGVETNGLKDMKKIKDFVKKAKQAFYQLQESEEK